MSAIKVEILHESEEWFALRQNLVTATDAPVITGANRYKTVLQLYHEKVEGIRHAPNSAMQRGKDLEPIARDMFCLELGVDVNPAIMVRDWTMASLDGLSADGKVCVEIKCPGEKTHSIAKFGKIPDIYYPQLQHQLYVTGLDLMYYYSFDGLDGVVLEVKSDPDFILSMLEKEKKFYEHIKHKIPPQPSDDDYIERTDTLWNHTASEYEKICCQIEDMEIRQQFLKNQLIQMSGGQNSKGGGVMVSSYTRKGNIDYSQIPELTNVNLEKYRKKDTECIRVRLV